MAITAEPKNPGDQLRQELEMRDWTQKELAARTGLSQPYISEMCRGTRAVSPRAAVAFEKAFGTLTAEEWLNLETQRRLRDVREAISA